MHKLLLIGVIAALGACDRTEVDKKNASVEEVAEAVADARSELKFTPGRWESNVTLVSMDAPGMPAGLADATLGGPLAVHRPEGGVHSWVVPAAAGEALAGFVQLLPDATVLRVSTFPGRPGSSGASWLDPGSAARKAAALRRPGETLGKPRLSFDGDPSRLAWLVVASGSGGPRRLFVAGDQAYEARAGPPATG